MQNFLVLILSMLASGAIGFYLARDRYLTTNDDQLRMLGSEIKRMRRKTREMESQNNRLKSERSRNRKPRF